MSHEIANPGRSPGLRNVGSYQASGHPFVYGATVADGAETKVSFPFVTKSITVIASGTTNDPLIGITFNSTSSAGNVISGKHYITMDSSGDSMTFDVKCKEIYIHAKNATSGFEMYASLTNIPTHSMYDLTGSGLTD
tara:strand:- start:6106 stop:6516 length:411 start_codon:yes stop_codon:yes gene_type:complete